ncbi:SprT-like domain-containing protein [Algoriphagus boritolerans]|uniref:SprT-like family protein n=2 Tax=Algoriphagus TaxID=246875 RepID=A0A1H5U7K4_9BACT|nr:SprT-like domain-containing protein [Algoriphagus boritolerans]SEF71000.1 SprT-like family protein [Algoriphagus boritolerans DSM 17298 = JCM 18970]
MNPTEQLNRIFEIHLPATAIAYCLELWQKTPFSFQVQKPRSSKLGDFRYRKDRKIQTITINSDLNPFQFLLTFIHEVAHLHTFEKFGNSLTPHGNEWKKEFQSLMSPLLTNSIFPNDILIPLRHHMKNPSASSSRDLFLMKEMSKYDIRNDSIVDQVFLSDLLPGKEFLLSGRKFKKGETKRTRVLCEDVNSGKKYLISRLAKVKPV